MERRNDDQNVETSASRVGFREGVMNDPTGVQHGVYVGEDDISPERMAEIRRRESKRNKDNKK